MCMNTSYGDGDDPSWNNPLSKKVDESSPEIATDPISSSDSSARSYDDNHDIVEFGPIKVKFRKKPAPTLATGRRSKYEVLSPEEEQKREVRRARNRAAADRVRLSRLNVEQQLQTQIDTLETREQDLLNTIQTLQNHKLHLQTRLLTREKMCHTLTLPPPTTTGLNPTSNSLAAFTTSNSSPTTTTTFERVESVSDINFDDLLLDPPTVLQNQEDNYSDSLRTIIPDVDPEDLFMNP